MMNPEWARSIRDQWVALGVSFFMKQMTGSKPGATPIPADLIVPPFPESKR